MIPACAGAEKSTRNAADSKGGAFRMMEKIDSYVVPGFLANGIHVGIKENGQKDLALLFSAVPAVASGLFTKNTFKAAPVLIDEEKIRSGIAQAILVNSGNANAATGSQGYEDAIFITKLAAKKLRIKEDRVLIASTGIIGHRLPVDKIESGMQRLVRGLHTKGIPDAEEAIMTTDKFPKMACRKGMISSKEITLCGIAKGAGMIEPHMATMLAFIMTDAAIEPSLLGRLFKQAVDASFNAITVDGCMSTNDTAIIMANGLAGNSPMNKQTRNLSIFRDMLFNVTSDLAKAMVRDGEGATKIMNIMVEEAKSKVDAQKIAYAIANSNLVKTAFFGGDPNWGRILSAAGSTGISMPVHSVRLYFEDVLVFSDGKGIEGHKDRLFEIMAQKTIAIRIKIGMGRQAFQVHASDLTHDYVAINAHYHT
jgi:glutamate N-acetyltransferase/amino-acid N-acetyltransferase